MFSNSNRHWRFSFLFVRSFPVFRTFKTVGRAFDFGSYIEDYFERNKDSEGWSNAFDFASWLYGDTQQEVLRNLQYFVERGVDAGFAIKTMKATSDDMWYPRRKELEAAGVIVE